MFALLVMLCTALSLVRQSETIFIHGMITNAETHMPIAQVSIMDKDNRTIAVSDIEGHYKFALKVPEAKLHFQAQGYRPYDYFLKVDSMGTRRTFEVAIKMFSIDEQVSNEPYHQAGQRSFLMSDTNAFGGNFARRIFKTVDIRTGQPIAGKICLFFTKDKRKVCTETVGINGYPVIFTSNDIIAIEVEATRYQKYYGNLILDRLDGKSVEYLVKLDRLDEIVVHGDSTGSMTGSTGQIDKEFQTISPPQESLILRFQKSSYGLTRETRATLDSVAVLMRQNKDYHLFLTGHTDNVGPAQLNQTLSEYRVRVVSTYLTNMGIDVQKIRYIGRGEIQPIASNLDENSRSQNRRVEIDLLR